MCGWSCRDTTVRDYVAVIKELKVIYRVIGYRANAARRGELNRGIALLDCAGCVDLKNRVRRADDDRSFYGKPGFCGGSRADVSCDISRLLYLGQH